MTVSSDLLVYQNILTSTKTEVIASTANIQITQNGLILCQFWASTSERKKFLPSNQKSSMKLQPTVHFYATPKLNYHQFNYTAEDSFQLPQSFSCSLNIFHLFHQRRLSTRAGCVMNSNMSFFNGYHPRSG